MADFHVSSFGELHAALEKHRSDPAWVFRGHSDVAWQLIPRVGRAEFAALDDRSIFESWKRRAVEYVEFNSETDWDWLAIAQHHGLATRLMDWSNSPLSAAFFAVRKKRDTDAVIYAAKFRNRQAPTDACGPFEMTQVIQFIPRGVAPRISRQAGCFSIHPDPAKPLEQAAEQLDGLDRLIISKAYRGALLRELSHYGINSASLFPDLDGIATFVNWAAVDGGYLS